MEKSIARTFNDKVNSAWENTTKVQLASKSVRKTHELHFSRLELGKSHPVHSTFMR